VNALGEGKLEFNPDGLVWTCVIRPEHMFGAEQGAAESRPQAATEGQQRAAQ
jgi:hypothetical protein